ncbi:unnamed protein product [Amoebophrya sp. A25]|nr:unnamed protein product [Amoebophrya sp. A25]|eukprot:GSA25T00014544001.1
MCYLLNVTSGFSQKTLLLLGCAVTFLYGVLFSEIFVGEYALTSQSLAAASAFTDRLTQDDNFFTPRIRLREWIATGEYLVYGCMLSTAIFAGIPAVISKGDGYGRVALKVFTGVVLLVTFSTFVLGLCMLMVVDSIGPILRQQSIDYCASPDYEFAMQGLGCDIHGNPLPMEFPSSIASGCGPSCQQRIEFLQKMENKCQNMWHLCKSRGYDEVHSPSTQSSKLKAQQSSLLKNDPHIGNLPVAVADGSGSSRLSLSYNGSQCALGPDGTRGAAAFRSPFPNTATHCEGLCDGDQLCTGYMTEEDTVGSGASGFFSTSPSAPTGERVYCTLYTHTRPEPNWQAVDQSHKTEPLVARSGWSNDEKLLDVAQKMSKDTATTDHDRTRTPRNPARRLGLLMGSQQQDGGFITYRCHVKGASLVVANFTTYVALFAFLCLTYSLLLVAVAGCSFGYLCPFSPAKTGFALCICTCCEPDRSGEGDDGEDNVELVQHGSYENEDAGTTALFNPATYNTGGAGGGMRNPFLNPRGILGEGSMSWSSGRGFTSSSASSAVMHHDGITGSSSSGGAQGGGNYLE